jgi:hypothetical protein
VQEHEQIKRLHFFLWFYVGGWSGSNTSLLLLLLELIQSRVIFSTTSTEKAACACGWVEANGRVAIGGGPETDFAECRCDRASPLPGSKCNSVLHSQIPDLYSHGYGNCADRNNKIKILKISSM